MHFTNKALWALLLSLALLGSVSCNQKPKYELVERINASAQVASFGISSEKNKALAKYVFSIDNTSEVGTISNLNPLPYGTELKDVTLPIKLLMAGKVTISIAGAEAVEWTEEKKYTIPTGAEIMLYVTIGEQAQYRYSYKVKINQYRYEPESISWREVYAQATSPVLMGDTQGFVFLNPKDASYCLTQSGRTDFYRLRTQQAPEPVAFSGLEQGDKIKRVLSQGAAVYALGTSGKLYELGKENNWRTLSNAEGVYELLGVLPAYGVEKSNQLAVLLQEAGTQRYRFAVYRRGVIAHKGNYAPADFPAVGEQGRFFAQGSTADYEGASLRLVGSSPSTSPGKSYRSLWFTSNGTSWAKSHEEKLGSAEARVFSPAFIHDTYYRWETGTQFTDIYYSNDYTEWHKSKTIALEGLSVAQLSQANSVLWAEAGFLHILSVDATGQLRLWQGEILKNKLAKQPVF